jgi:hypothetical protein
VQPVTAKKQTAAATAVMRVKNKTTGRSKRTDIVNSANQKTFASLKALITQNDGSKEPQPRSRKPFLSAAAIGCNAK